MNGNMTLGSRIERLEKNNKPIETTDNIRIGNVIADGTMGGSTSKNINVVFDKPLKSINYSVALSSTFGGENWGSVATTIGNKTVQHGLRHEGGGRRSQLVRHHSHRHSIG